MSGFVAPAPVPPADPPADTLANDGWFPDLTLSDMRNAVRIDGTVTDERLIDSLLYAMDHVNQQLATYKADRIAEGINSLVDASAGQVLGGKPRLVQLYLRAVRCEAKADLTERYRDFDADGANPRVTDNAPAIDEQRRNAQWAVRDILGQTHSVVELI